MLRKKILRNEDEDEKVETGAGAHGKIILFQSRKFKHVTPLANEAAQVQYEVMISIMLKCVFTR